MILFLVVLLIVPVLLVPAAASGNFMYYNGHLLPELPSVDSSTFPYSVIVKYPDGSIWPYGAFYFDKLGYVTDVVNAYGQIVYTVDGGAYTLDYYIFADELNIWQKHPWYPDPDTYDHPFICDWPEQPDSGVIWSNVDLYSADGSLYLAASQPGTAVVPNVPTFTTNLQRNKIYSYQLDQVASQLFVDAISPGGESLVYQWQTYLNGSWASISNSSTDTRYFTPPTTVEGTFQYRCLVYYSTYGPISGTYSNTVYVVVGSGAVPDDSVSVGDQVIIDQISGVQDSINDVKDSIDSVNDSLNATSPSLDSSIGDLEDASGTVDQFEDDQWNSINDNIGDVIGAFDAFQDGSLAAAFGFLGGIVNNTFDSLGHWQVVITLPLALGLILYICSRSPLNSIPRIRDQAAAEVEAVKRADMRQSEAAYRKSYEYYRENRGRNESYSARYNAEMGRKKK